MSRKEYRRNGSRAIPNRTAQKLTRCARLVAVALATLAAGARADGQVLMFIAMGQSNSVGMAPFGSSLMYVNEGRMHAYGNDGEWHTPAREPLDSCAEQVDPVSCDPQAGAGWVLPAVDGILAARLNDEAIIVPCARGGSSSWEWQRDLRRDTLYGSCLARVREAATQWLEQTGVAPAEYVVLHWQGEVDAKAGEVFATSWAARFARLRADWEADIGQPVRWVVAALKPDPPPGYPAWLTIRGYQIAAKDARTAYFGTGNVPYQTGGLHPTLAGYQTIAAGAARAYLFSGPVALTLAARR